MVMCIAWNYVHVIFNLRSSWVFPIMGTNQT